MPKCALWAITLSAMYTCPRPFTKMPLARFGIGVTPSGATPIRLLSTRPLPPSMNRPLRRLPLRTLS
jgi:hypothetical protein